MWRRSVHSWTKLLEVDLARKRIALTMKLNQTGAACERSGADTGQGAGANGGHHQPASRREPQAAGATAIACALARVGT